MTESDIYIILDFEGDISIRAVLDRVLAPLIVEDIQARLPIDERAALLRGEMKITLGLKRGNLKPTKSVRRGDIAYMPLGDSLCIYLKDMKTYSPVNVIGRIISDDSEIDLLKNVRRGSQVRIRSS